LYYTLISACQTATGSGNRTGNRNGDQKRQKGGDGWRVEGTAKQDQHAQGVSVRIAFDNSHNPAMCLGGFQLILIRSISNSVSTTSMLKGTRLPDEPKRIYVLFTTTGWIAFS